MLNIIPTTSLDALARNDVLRVLFFAVLLVWLSLLSARGEKVTALVERCHVLFRMMG